jgi:photosystem II stability/assembly factor-like uncharacterized protein
MLEYNTPLFVFLFIVIAVNSSYAQWEATSGPYGGQIDEINSFNGELYAVHFSNIYTSKDKALTWQKLPALPSEIYVNKVLKVDSHLMISSSRGFFVTTDEGENWESRNSEIFYDKDEWRQDSSVNGLIIHNDTLICYNSQGIFASGDYGNSWIYLDTNFVFGTQWMKSIDSTLYLYTGSLYSKKDLTDSWSLLAEQPTNHSIYKMVKIDSILFTATFKGLFQSSDSGKTWIMNPSLPIDINIQSLVIKGADLYLAAPDSGVYRSQDLGKTWELYKNGLVKHQMIEMISDGVNLYLSIFPYGIYKSSDSTRTWSSSSLGLEKITPLRVRFVGDTLIAAFQFGVFISSNFGEHWQSAGNGLFSSHITDMEIINNQAYISSLDGLYSSSDAGLNWVKIFKDTAVMSIAGNEDFLIGGSYNGVVFISRDQGETWDSKDFGGNAAIREVTVHGDEVILGGLSINGIFYSSNGGRTWEKRAMDLPSGTMSMDYDGKFLYIGTQGGIHKSLDKGLSWEFVNYSFPTQVFAQELLIHDSMVFAATVYGNGVYCSLNQGESWHTISDKTRANSITIKDNLIYAAFDGVHKRKLSAFVGVNQLSIPRFMLNPNPAHNDLSVKFPSIRTAPVPYSIIDIRGKEVAKSTIDLSSTFIDISSLTPGVYFLRFTTSKEYSVAKFVKQ